MTARNCPLALGQEPPRFKLGRQPRRLMTTADLTSLSALCSEQPAPLRRN